MTCWLLKSKDTFLYHSVTADTRSYTLHTDASCPVGFAGILGFLPAHRSSLFRLLRVFSPLPDFLQWRVIWNHVLASLFFFPLYPKHFIHDMLKFNVDSWFSNLLYRLLVWKWYKRETLETNVSYRKENLILFQQLSLLFHLLSLKTFGLIKINEARVSFVVVLLTVGGV